MIALLVILASAPADDRMLQALEDEMQRSIARLHLPPSKKPYYLSYTVLEIARYDASASFGAMTNQGSSRRRHLTVDARVGDYRLDNTNFADDSEPQFWNPIPVDDDYDAIRHSVWLATDRSYKHAIEQREKKLAYLQVREVKNRPDDFSREPPTVRLQAIQSQNVDRELWSKEARRLSAIFREYPRVAASSVTFTAEAKNRWFVNNEGSRVRIGSGSNRLVAVAASHGRDGVRFIDYEVISVEPAGGPAREEAVRRLADRLSKLPDAAVMGKYRGPVLFERAAAADFFAQALAPHLSAPRELLGPRGFQASAYAMRDELGRRVLPPFITVTDDPTVKELGGAPILGWFEIDDDGVVPKKLTLVEKGVLKTFCMSRAPTRELQRSNGRSVRGWGMPGTLFVSSERALKPEELRRALIELGAKEELEHVYVVKKMSTRSPWSLASWAPAWVPRAANRRASEVALSAPVLLYRVSVRDGSETLVRGAVFGNHSLRVLRDIEATGDDVQAHPVTFGGEMRTVVTPSLLIEEIELETAADESEKPPILGHPFFDR